MYPALAVLQALGDNADEILWVGSEDGMEAELVAKAGIPFRPIPAAGVHGVSLGALPGNLWELLKGVFAAKKIIEEYKPDVLFFTGGYVAIPTGLAGWRAPTLLYVPDIEPGLALKLVARFADSIAVTAEDSRAYFSRSAPVSVSGYPTRVDLMTVNRDNAFQTFNLSPELQTLLVFGGSKGARSINRALVTTLPAMLAEMQIIHITGTFTWPEMKAAGSELPDELASRYRAYPYLHEEMGAALSIADLAVSRAGASALGEFPLFGLPAVLVPYPHAWRYQKINAEYLAQRDAAVILKDEELEDGILTTVQTLMNSAERREKMHNAMLKLAQPNAGKRIAEMLIELAQG